MRHGCPGEKSIIINPLSSGSLGRNTYDIVTNNRTTIDIYIYNIEQLNIGYDL